MKLSSAQVEQFDRDGFLVFPDLFSRNEVAVLRREVARLSQVRSEEVVREPQLSISRITSPTGR